MKERQNIAIQNSQMQAQQAQQATRAASQSKQQEMQKKVQLKAQAQQMKHEVEVEVEGAKHAVRKDVEENRAQAALGIKTDDKEFKEKIEVLKEDRKGERVDKQAAKQSKLISQRKGERGEIEESQAGFDISEMLQ